MTTISKQAEAHDDSRLTPTENKLVMLPDTMRDKEGWREAFDLGVAQLILLELAAHQDEVYRMGDRARRQTDDKVRKAALKALAKRAKNGELTQQDFALAREVAFAKHLPGEHDQDDHNPHKDEPSGPTSEERAQGLSSTMENYADSAVEDASDFAFTLGENLVDGRSLNATAKVGDMFNQIAAGADRLTTWNQQVNEGMKEALGQETWGRRITSGINYLAKNKSSSLAERANLMANYGLFAGSRMARNYARYGGFDVPLPARDEAQEGEIHEGSDRSAVEKFLRGRLPNKEAHDLAGDRLPSEGFIIGPDGEVKSRAVGRKGDHFTPFGMKHVRQMRKQSGGEFIRMRSAGGLTVEDLHIGMMTGMDRVTVVSNNGTFSMAITDRAKGLRSEHFSILSSYQQLLDQQAPRGGAGFAAYDNAMSALTSQFPLHFKKQQSDRAQQSDRFTDWATPANTLLDEFRSIFGQFSQGSKAEERVERDSLGRTVGFSSNGVKLYTLDPQTGRKQWSGVFPGRKPNDSFEDWAQRMRQNGRGDLVSQAEEKLGWRDPQHRQSQSGGIGRATKTGPTRPSGQNWIQKPSSQQVQRGRPGQPMASPVRTSYTEAQEVDERARTEQVRLAERERDRAMDAFESDPNIVTGRGTQGVDFGEYDPDRVPLDWSAMEDDERQILRRQGYDRSSTLTEGDASRILDAIDEAESYDPDNTLFD